MTLEQLQTAFAACAILLFGFMVGLTVNRQAEHDHWRCAFMPWKCPFAGYLFIYAAGVTALLLLITAVCGKRGLGLL